MQFRRSPFPHRMVEFNNFLLVGVLLPIVLLYDIIIVLPAFHEPGSFLYNLTLLISVFGLFNLEGNIIACMIIDISIKTIAIPSAENPELLEWRHCTICDKLAPPRSWHCQKCDVCILKRDHHCLFTGCCIGHQNRRYFMCFLLYLVIGTTYAFSYNSIYMFGLNSNIYFNWLTAFKIFIPMSMAILGSFWSNLQIFVYCLNMAALIYAFTMFVYHVPNVLRGEVCAERGKQHEYNKGLKLNLRSTFGQRVHFVWLSPFVKSPLPDNGYGLKNIKD